MDEHRYKRRALCTVISVARSLLVQEFAVRWSMGKGDERVIPRCCTTYDLMILKSSPQAVYNGTASFGPLDKIMTEIPFGYPFALWEVLCVHWSYRLYLVFRIEKTPTIEEPIIQDSDGDGFSAEEDSTTTTLWCLQEPKNFVMALTITVMVRLMKVFWQISMWFDGDGFGKSIDSGRGLRNSSGFVTNGSDCDDSNELSYPSANEICDGLDNIAMTRLTRDWIRSFMRMLMEMVWGSQCGSGSLWNSRWIVRLGRGLWWWKCQVNPIVDEACDDIDNNYRSDYKVF